MQKPWKPNLLITILLGFSATPLSFLYLRKPSYFWIALVLIWLISAFFLYMQPWFISADYLGIVLGTPIVIIGAFICKNSLPIEANERPWYSKWWGMLSIAVTFAGAVVLFRSFIYETFEIPSGSMLPTLSPGKIILVQKWGYGNYGSLGVTLLKTKPSKPVKHGDIIVFEFPDDPRLDYVKRVIALPGDTVRYNDRNLEVFASCNKAPSTQISECDANIAKLAPSEKVFDVDEDLAWQVTVYQETLHASSYDILYRQSSFDKNYVEYTVPEGHLFVLGDNRDNSSDSRYWGYVPIGNVKGVVMDPRN